LLTEGSRLKQAYFLLGRAYQKLGRETEAKAPFGKLDEMNRGEASGAKKEPTEEGARKPTDSHPRTGKPAAEAGARGTKRKSIP